MKATIVLLLVSVLVPVLTSGCLCDEKWVKINTDQVCFGAKNNAFGSFTPSYEGLFVSAFKLRHISGYVSCGTNRKSNWGCDPYRPTSGTFVTDDENQSIAPHTAPTPSNRFYELEDGASSSSPEITIQLPSLYRLAGKLRLWYGEDLVNTSEGDNSGTACVDVFVAPA